MVFFENIKRMMGWCPSVNSMENIKALHFDEAKVNAPESGDKSIHTTRKWWNKYKNKVLVGSLISIPWVIHLSISYGIKEPDIFLAGMITGLVFSLATVMAEWQMLNKVATGKYINRIGTKKNMIFRSVIVMGLMIIAIFGFTYLIEKIGFRAFYAFFAGAILFIWPLLYFEVMYWERKNKKILIMEITSFYAVDANEGTNE